MSSDPIAVRQSHPDAIEIVYSSEADAENWDRFVESHPEGRYFHLWGYRRALENACGYRCIYMKIQSSGRLIGIFPAIKTRRRGWMISQPFHEYGSLSKPSPKEASLLIPSLALWQFHNDFKGFDEVGLQKLRTLYGPNPGVSGSTVLSRYETCLKQEAANDTQRKADEEHFLSDLV